MNSCGLSTKLAIDISKRVNLKNTHDPDSVLNLFRNYGFSDIQISKIVQKHPKVLLMKSEKSLLPKLRFFQSIGFSCSQLPELLVSKPLLLLPSLKQCIIPRYESLKSVLDDNQKVIKALRCPAWDFLKLDARNVDLNIKFLRQLGVPQSSVSSLVTKFPGVAFMEHAKFVENVQFIRKAGIPTFKVLFIRALYVSSLTKKSTWEFKLDIFERCGWSRDVTFSAFMKFPFCMLLSETKSLAQ
ncbi:uncharacterized protein LOC129318628 isoform X2 [Prosopis cineraria]|nr:uncharacterized protein LOC129318628 isoform X2 [Prosopis cineraria]XP_054819473.1 uncharacterized protein LOC129318628 isoform X2 [Prosopis cineraria]